MSKLAWEQVAGETVAESVARGPFAEAGLAHRLDRLLHLRFVQVIAPYSPVSGTRVRSTAGNSHCQTNFLAASGLLGSEEFVARMQDLLEDKREIKEIPRSQRYPDRPPLSHLLMMSRLATASSATSG